MLRTPTGKVLKGVPLSFEAREQALGAVPGGKYHFVSGPGFSLLERQTRKVVWRKRLLRFRPGQPTFSADGSLCALPVTDTETPHGKNAPAQMVCLLSLSDGTIRGAIAVPEGIDKVFLRPDGRALLVVKLDNSLELWDLSTSLRRDASR